MKLVTDVTPRADGTVTAIAGGNRYVFKQDDDGRLACEVGSKADSDALLDTGNFYPATEDDSAIDLDDAAKAQAVEDAAAALDAAQAAHDAEPTDETAAALDAAQKAVALLAVPVKAAGKASGKKKK